MLKLPANPKVVAYSAITALMGGAAVFAADEQGLGRIKVAAGCMCGQLMQVLPVVSMLMIIGAGVVYAAGQMMGAETRARANTWATAMLVGAVIGILIVVVAPNILNILYGDVEADAFATTANICDVSMC
ncbi:MAG: hypothetical protein ABIH83_06175 [Candidatus Micrarchaeota archaeon]